MEKPTTEQLKTYLQKDRRYFDHLANYYYKNDKEYYNHYIYPLYSTIYPSQIECPYCHQKVYPYRYTRISTGGWVMIVLGLVFVPILLGIIFIIIGINMKDIHSMCSNCHIRYN